jgi:DegV family protein with EDD domain
MAKVGIVIDSIASLTREIAERFSIAVVPYYVNYGGKSFRDDFTFDKTHFYRQMPSMKQFPTTAHPNLYDLVEVFSRLMPHVSGILYLTTSAQLSSTVDLAYQAKKQFPKMPIEIYEGGVGIGRLALLALEAATRANGGATMQEIISGLDDCNRQAGFYGVLNTLEYLARGGRIGKAQALLGTILSIKPVLTFKNGTVVPAAKVSTQRAALDWIIKRMHAEAKRTNARTIKCIIDEVDGREWSGQVKDRLEKEFECQEIYQLTMSPVAGVHLGPGSWAVSYLLQ